MRTLTLVMTALLIVAEPLSAQQKPKDLQWTHAFDLSCRASLGLV